MVKLHVLTKILSTLMPMQSEGHPREPGNLKQSLYFAFAMFVLFALLLQWNFLSRRCIKSPDWTLCHCSILTLNTFTRFLSVCEPEWSPSASSSVSDIECSEDIYSMVIYFICSPFSSVDYVSVLKGIQGRTSHHLSHIITCKQPL